MAARARGLVSTVPPTAQRQQISSELPDYQPALFTLDADSQRLLHSLASKYKLDKLNEDLALAITKLTNTATDVNERVSDQRLRRQRARDAGEGPSSSLSAEDSSAFAQDAEKLTQRMEASVQKIIDSQHSMSWLKESLSESVTHARAHASTQASIPASSRPRPAGNAEDMDEDSDDEAQDEHYSEINPTAESTQHVIGPSAVFKQQFELRQQRYRDTSLAERYTTNTDYRNHKEMVHSALYPDEEVAAPAPSTWFQERPLARPGVTQAGDADDSDEEDIQMTRAVTSTRCPITLQEFKQPLTSNKCPHTYEASAILQMIEQSSTRTPPDAANRHGLKAVQCPVQGCTNLLTPGDLREDQIVLRRIRRLQRVRQLEEEEMSENHRSNGTQQGAMIIDEENDTSFDIDDIEDDEMPPPSKHVKREKRSSMR